MAKRSTRDEPPDEPPLYCQFCGAFMVSMNNGFHICESCEIEYVVGEGDRDTDEEQEEYKNNPTLRFAYLHYMIMNPWRFEPSYDFEYNT